MLRIFSRICWRPKYELGLLKMGLALHLFPCALLDLEKLVTNNLESVSILFV